MNSGLTVCVLGPVEVQGVDAYLGGRHARLALGMLALAANRGVTIDSLIEAVWRGEPPRTAVATLQSVISRLRKVLGTDAITRIDHSYQLNAECSELDVCSFERLASMVFDLARTEPAMAVEYSDEAEGLWRGPVLGEFHDEVFARPEVVKLDELRVAVQEARLEALVVLGKVDQAVPSLRSCIEEHPHREHLWTLLIRALCDDGRRLEAHDVYDRYEEMLAATGLTPSASFPELVGEAS